MAWPLFMASACWGQFQEISHSYSILSDKDKKSRFDKFGDQDDVPPSPIRIQKQHTLAAYSSEGLTPPSTTTVI
eukprot:3496575-Rhodomonas_salina.2